jgi:hypothetical protein
MFIWFNLLLTVGPFIWVLETFNTLEECQDRRAKHEVDHPGMMAVTTCQWVAVEKI